MPNLSKRCEEIFKSIESKISNKEEKDYVMEKVRELSYMYLELIDRITELDSKRLEKLEDNQDALLATVSTLKESVDLIKSDIYEEDGYDFEIVCPYCNHEFVADVESELKEEIECPECHNIIELDWDDDEEGCDSCSGHCHSCHHEDHNEEDYDEENDDEEDM